LAALLAAVLAAQDAEHATHTDTASKPQIAYEASGDGWRLRQYQLGCLSHLSYLLVSGSEAVVVDPQRDVERYEADAKELGARITQVWLTHPHADFVAGHTELAQRTGATIAISALAKAEFAHRALQDGDRLTLGRLTLEAWATPGHTPNAMTFLVHAADHRSPSPATRCSSAASDAPTCSTCRQQNWRRSRSPRSSDSRRCPMRRSCCQHTVPAPCAAPISVPTPRRRSGARRRPIPTCRSRASRRSSPT
jgi:hypothetical protein